MRTFDREGFTLAILSSTTLSALERLVLLALAWHAAKDGAWAASAEELGASTGLRPDSARVTLLNLERAGAIRVAECEGRFVGLLFHCQAPEASSSSPASSPALTAQQVVRAAAIAHGEGQDFVRVSVLVAALLRERGLTLARAHQDLDELAQGGVVCLDSGIEDDDPAHEDLLPEELLLCPRDARGTVSLAWIREGRMS